MYVIKSVVKNKGNEPIIKVHTFSFRVAIATFNKNKTRKTVSVLLNLIHFTGNIQVGGQFMNLSYLNYLGITFFDVTS
jgi:hypothetical protein